MSCFNPKCKGNKAGYLVHMRATPKEKACEASKHAWRTYYAKRRK